MKITSVRHGETEENVRQIIQGQFPGTLSTRGKQQALDLGKKLASETFDYIYSSDLQRCVDTTEAIIAHHQGAPINYAQALREQDQRGYEGQPWDSIPWATFAGTTLSRKVPGGESWLDIRARLVAFFNQLYEAHPRANVLLVMHGGTLRVAESLFTDQTLEETVEHDIDNCSIWHWEMNSPLEARI